MRIAGPVLASSRLRRLAAVGLLSGLFLLQGCATPTDYRSWERGQPVYYVKGGDTLYSIAVANDLDWQRLARWNGISNPRHLKIGQRLRLSPPGGGGAISAGRSSAPAASRTPVKTASNATKPRSSTPAASPVSWKWPLEGRVLHRFPEGAPAQKGVILAAAIDTPVRAAAGGRVVYSGDGLPGYGNLVIVKHNADWLSAYAYNKSLAVAEGDEVRSGQTIARVGARDHRKPERGGHLLFQIRRQGKPVDPERYLP
ncbi:peptidoglycan DD-metalloendopeptidase family protein [Guyparkeria hydrothermalis]|uniref:peptidoglycan DD-metalloendopeptidase family protein n=1 Tax=Guyparkeria TaxID=2035712 RepID=UPI0010AB912A|nr:MULTISPECIES: peptidoglycan DD-metalloendopeptidase family protein [Guyparkeria]MCL7750910.1 peptidoglycan DD-metalloendopeptidase family protein [Guyparkeria hydrothermalis]TKA90622.1 LysM peptidoglycan-binding domain-containing protein [Guyparkeria sp. SB14A]